MARGGRASGLAVVALAAAFAGPSAVSAGQARAARDPEVRRLKAGIFLYASPSLRDSNFAETVVLLVEYGPNGAMGLVINRPTDWRASEAMKDAVALHKLIVHWGGPVQPEAVFGLVGTARKPKGGVRVLDGVYLTGKRKDLDAAARQDETGERVRVYAGYSGWGAGQLDGEVLRSGWIVAPGDAEAVFSRRPEEVWEEVHRLQGRLEVLTSPVRTPWQHAGLWPGLFVRPRDRPNE